MLESETYSSVSSPAAVVCVGFFTGADFLHQKPPWACQISQTREMCALWKGYAHPASGLRDAPLFPGMSHILSEAR